VIVHDDYKLTYRYNNGGGAVSKQTNENNTGRRKEFTHTLLVQHLGCTSSSLAQTNGGKRWSGEWRHRIFPTGARTPPWAHRRPNIFLSLGSNQNGLITWCFIVFSTWATTSCGPRAHLHTSSSQIGMPRTWATSSRAWTGRHRAIREPCPMLPQLTPIS
jgi:hypothetical protein